MQVVIDRRVGEYVPKDRYEWQIEELEVGAYPAKGSISAAVASGISSAGK